MQDLLIKAATVIAVAFATFSSFPGTAQQDSTAQQVQQNVPTQQNSARPNGNGAAMSKAALALKPECRELVDNLDAKSAKQGNCVIVKADQKKAAGAEIHEGSQLSGHR